MNSIQKEREAFEQHLTNTGLVEFSDYGFAVDECNEYLHEPTQVAWDSWLIGLNRAQAVPEGFVLVEREKLAMILETATNALVYHAAPPKHDALSIIQGIARKAVIEAQEQGQ